MSASLVAEKLSPRVWLEWVTASVLKEAIVVRGAISYCGACGDVQLGVPPGHRPGCEFQRILRGCRGLVRP